MTLSVGHSDQPPTGHGDLSIGEQPDSIPEN